MDWIRKMFGSSDIMPRSESAFRNPTWEEIFDNRNFSDRPQPPDGQFQDFHRGGTYSFSTGANEDSFSSVFGQMDDMFRQLDSVMRNFHEHPGGHVIITEGPDFDGNTEPQSPRDSFLKKPDSEVPDSYPSPHHHFPRHQSPFYGPIIADPDQRGGDFDEGPGGFGNFQEFSIRDPFNMMEDFFKSFGGGFGMVPFGENPGVPVLLNPGAESDESPRDALVKKEDTDLDDRITGNFSELLKEMPKYDPPVIPGQPGLNQTEETQQPQPPHFQQRYHSTSIARIRRPDGSVEETRKYTDSTGREEVTVTHSQPEDGSTPGSLLRQGDQGILDGHNGHGHFLPSLFSWFSTR